MNAKSAFSALIGLLAMAAVNTTLSAVPDPAAVAKQNADYVANGVKWLIEDGVASYMSGGKNALFRHLLDVYKVQLWVTPGLNDNYHLAYFNIKASKIWAEVMNLHREKIGNKYYEFWINKITVEKGSPETNRTEFYVASTLDINGKRQILLRSGQFIPSYSQGGVVFDFPINNLRVIYEMKPWLYPENYLNTDIDERVVIYKDGKAQYR